MKFRSLFVRLAALALLISALFSAASCRAIETVFTKIYEVAANAGISDLSGRYEGYYGFALLREREDGTLLQNVYDQIFRAVENREESLRIPFAHKGITKEQFVDAFDVYSFDHPEHFWLDPTEYTVVTNSIGGVLGVNLTYLFSSEELPEAKRKFNERSQYILRFIGEKESQYDTELALHDFLAGHIRYFDGERAHSAYGAIVEKYGVCEGYAKAFEYLLQQKGIQSYVVTGTRETEAHGWNLVQIDGQYYYTDLTWDDTGRDGYISHAYFNMTEDMAKESRSFFDPPVSLPLCENDEGWYYNKSDLIVRPPFSVQAIARRIDKDRCFIACMPNELSRDRYIDFVKDNIKEILFEASLVDGKTNYRVSLQYSYTGNEVFYKIEIQFV